MASSSNCAERRYQSGSVHMGRGGLALRFTFYVIVNALADVAFRLIDWYSRLQNTKFETVMLKVARNTIFCIVFKQKTGNNKESFFL